MIQLAELELQRVMPRRLTRGGGAAGEQGGEGGADADQAVVPGTRRAVIANVHLTFPHSEFDRRLRYWQAQKSVSALERFSAGIVGAAAAEDGSRPSPLQPGDLEIITGDFNLPALQVDEDGNTGHGIGSKRDPRPRPYRVKSDPVYRMLLERGFVSGYRQIHRREPLATHVTHTGDYSTADFVFFRVVG